MRTFFPRLRGLAILGALLLAVGIAAYAADVDGTWTATFDTQIGEQHYTYVLKADGEKLTGSAKNDRGETQITDGVIKGNDVSFTEKLDFNGQEIVIKYTGTMDGDKINFTREVGNFATEKVVATRQKSK